MEKENILQGSSKSDQYLKYRALATMENGKRSL